MNNLEWISVNDKLPEKSEYDWVLVATKLIPEDWYGVPHIAEFRNGEWYDVYYEKSFEELLSIKVTHWMPLPENPK